MSLSLNVKFSNGEAYFPGQTISGVVTVFSYKPRKCRSLELHWLGNGSVSWIERSGDDTERYSEQEEYLNSVVVLKAAADGHKMVKLEAGVTKIPFSFVLPNSLPASFYNSNGKVRYSVTACARFPWYKPDVKAVKIFSVVGHFDLNDLPPPYVEFHTSLTQGSVFIKSTTISSWFQKCGNVEIQVSLPRIGFVPGERIPFSVVINNKSTESFKTCSFKFVQECTLHAHGCGYGIADVLVKKLQGELLRPGETMIRDNESILVPPLPPSGLGGSGVIDVQYCLNFEVTFNLFVKAEKKLKIRVPIIIGTVPLRPTFGDLTHNKLSGDLSESGEASKSTVSYSSLEKYRDCSSHKFVKSAVYKNRLFDYGRENQLKYHPFCIFFENQGTLA